MTGNEATEKHTTCHYGCKQVSRLTQYPSFDMGFDRAVNGGNDLFGESVSLINFIKVRTVFEFCLCFPWLATSHCSWVAHRLVPLWSFICLALEWPSCSIYSNRRADRSPSVSLNISLLLRAAFQFCSRFSLRVLDDNFQGFFQTVQHIDR